MKRRGNLNQTLQKLFVWVRRLQPHLFPMFVGVVKMSGIKRFKSFLIEPIFFAWIHSSF